MSMTKKDFIALADAVRSELYESNDSDISDYSRDRIVDALCAFMRGQNPNFLEVRWRAYLAGECEPGGGKIKLAKAHKVSKGADHWFCSCGTLFPNPGGETRAKQHVYGGAVKKHKAVLTGKCATCGHYGDDCTGAR